MQIAEMKVLQFGPHRGGTTSFQDSLQVRPCKLGRDVHVAHGPERR